MSLKDTLEKRQRESAQIQSLDKQAYIDEWKHAVDSLLRQIEEFLHEYKERGWLQFETGKLQVTEDALDTYEISQLTLRAPGSAVIMIEPVGRMIIGAVGRVDIYRQGHIAKDDRVMVLRRHPTLDWQLSLPPEIKSFTIMSTQALSQALKRQIVPFTKQNLEAALDRLLQ
jgi:hypothetical protein